jgi:hypothetical protein
MKLNVIQCSVDFQAPVRGKLNDGILLYMVAASLANFQNYLNIGKVKPDWINRSVGITYSVNRS